MRILHISSARVYGRSERHVADLCRELVARGHQVFVALRPTNEWQEHLNFLPAESFMHVSIRNSFGTFSAKRIARFIESEKIDIVHAHVARDYLAAGIACRISKNVCLVLTRHLASPLKPFHRFALRNVDAAIAISARIRVQLDKIFSPEKVYTILNGLNISDHHAGSAEDDRREFRSLHNIPYDVPLVITIGELKVSKGQRDFVLAANEIVKASPDCRFVIAGKDNSIDQSFRRELKRLVRVLGHDDRFLWLDEMADLSQLLAAADIFVSPSHSGGFDSGILDAIEAGTFVVATGTEAVKELIPDETALVPARDPLALADKVAYLLAESNVRRGLSNRQREDAGRIFSLERMVDATEEVYKKVLDR